MTTSLTDKQAKQERIRKQRTAWNRLLRIPTAHASLWVIGFVCLIALLSYLTEFLQIPLTPYDYAQTSDAILQPPSSQHWMGTDELGRDMLARVVFGSRLSISIGMVTALMGFAIGTIYGAIAGYCGGRSMEF